MSDPRLDEIEDRLYAITTGPWEHQPYGGQNQNGDYSGGYILDGHGEYLISEVSDRDGPFIAHAPADVAVLLAELRKARRAAQTLGQVIEKQCRDVLDVTGLHHLINEDGDGHWDVVWMRLFEMRDELASLKESTIWRERVRGDSWRDRAQETTVRLDDAVEELRKRDEVVAKLSDWAGRYKSAYYDEAQDDVVQIIKPVLRAAVAAAKGNGE